MTLDQVPSSERGVTMINPSVWPASSKRNDDGALMLSPCCSGTLIVVLELIVLVFLLPGPGLPRLVCRFFAHCPSGISLSMSTVLLLRAGTTADLGLYRLKDVEDGGSGLPRNSTITARRTVDMRSAG